MHAAPICVFIYLSVRCLHSWPSDLLSCPYSYFSLTYIARARKLISLTRLLLPDRLKLLS